MVYGFRSTSIYIYIYIYIYIEVMDVEAQPTSIREFHIQQSKNWSKIAISWSSVSLLLYRHM
jgi:hypothetical protein